MFSVSEFKSLRLVWILNCKLIMLICITDLKWEKVFKDN